MDDCYVFNKQEIFLTAQCLYCRNTSDLYKSLDKCKVGDVLDLEVLRQTGDKGKEHVSVTLESG